MGGSFVVTGGRPLYGSVRIPAAKNSVLPLLAASLLCEGPVRLRGVPHLLDVEACLSILRGLGCTAGWQGADAVVSGAPRSSVLPPREAAQMRASMLFCAPLLARLGRAETVLPGGCRIGARPVDLHLEGLTRMGAREQPADPGHLVLTAPMGLHGIDHTLRFPSVGATETLLLAAVSARGETVLRGAAREPEIIDLARFLNLCGGRVQGAGTSVIRVQGRRVLGGAAFTPVPDRIFASTLACAAASAGGRIELSGCAPELYAPVLDVLEQAGCGVERGAEGAVVSRFGQLHGVGRVFTGVYPGLATDAAPPLAAALLCADSGSSIEDIVFERRFGCAEGFARLGACVEVRGRTLCIQPAGPLRGTMVCAPDLRGGAALVLAALAAQGAARIEGTEHIERGYACFSEILSGLGARIDRETSPKASTGKKTTSNK
ncbi:MAG: UDP-N-acetylglucosamine 1-carboxyvinyltransferase [Faecalibacterium sp.]